MNTKLIVLGTYGQRFVDLVVQVLFGSALVLDTAVHVKNLERENVKTIHLVLNPFARLAKNILKALLNASGSDGAALVESYAYAIFDTDRGLRTAIERFVADADLLFVIASTGGGTGNGAFQHLVRIIRLLRPPCRTIYIHAVNPVVNPEKQLSRLRDLSFIGTDGWREGHVFAKDDATVESILCGSRETFDAVEEVFVNVVAQKGGVN